MSITSSNPVDIKVADNAQLMGLNLGNGLFSLPGKVTINGVTMPISTAMAQIIPGTSVMQIKVRDYFAMCNGVILGHGNLGQLNFTDQLTTVTIPSAGIWYIVMNPSTYVGFDDDERPDFAPGIITAQTALPIADVNPNTILLGKVTVPSNGVMITTGMIDQSQKQFLISIPELVAQVNTTPSNLQSQILALQASLTALQAQVNSQANLVTTATVTSANVDLVNSTIGLSGNNQFVLPSFNPTIYFNESFTYSNGNVPTTDTYGSISAYNFGGVGPQILNDQFVLSDGTGNYGAVSFFNTVTPPAGEYTFGFDAILQGPADSPYTGIGWGYWYFGYYFIQLGLSYDNNGNCSWNLFLTNEAANTNLLHSAIYKYWCK